MYWPSKIRRQTESRGIQSRINFATRKLYIQEQPCRNIVPRNIVHYVWRAITQDQTIIMVTRNKWFSKNCVDANKVRMYDLTESSDNNIELG